MTDKEALKLALEAFERSVATCFDQYSHQQVMSHPEHFINKAISAIKEALAQPAPTVQGCDYCNHTLYAGTKCKNCGCEPAPVQYPLPDDMYDSKDWRDADYAGRVEWLHTMYESSKRTLDAYTTPPAQPEERNFCSRCGKRTRDLTAIHTCTPPQEKTS